MIDGLDMAVQELLSGYNDDEIRYMIALVRAGHDMADGVRIPNLVNDSTIAIKDH